MNQSYNFAGIRYTEREANTKNYSVNDAIKAATIILKDRRSPVPVSVCLNACGRYHESERDEKCLTMIELNDMTQEIVSETDYNARVSRTAVPTAA